MAITFPRRAQCGRADKSHRYTGRALTDIAARLAFSRSLLRDCRRSLLANRPWTPCAEPPSHQRPFMRSCTETSCIGSLTVSRRDGPLLRSILSWVGLWVCRSAYGSLNSILMESRCCLWHIPTQWHRLARPVGPTDSKTYRPTDPQTPSDEPISQPRCSAPCFGRTADLRPEGTYLSLCGIAPKPDALELRSHRHR